MTAPVAAPKRARCVDCGGPRGGNSTDRGEARFLCGPCRASGKSAATSQASRLLRFEQAAWRLRALLASPLADLLLAA